MRYLFASILIVLSLMACGCGPSSTPLETNARKFRAGISQKEVSVLFERFHSGETNEYHDPIESFCGVLGTSGRVVFKTGVERGTSIGYWPEGYFSAFELCVVYFDTNGIIVGYNYYRE